MLSATAYAGTSSNTVLQAHVAAHASTQIAVDSNAQYEYFVRDDNTACITRCISSSKSIDIPASIDGWEVAELAAGSFANLRSAELIQCPTCMRCIGDRAFSGCHTLRELRLNEGLQYIGSRACENCISLSSIFVPASVESMGCNITGSATGKWRTLSHACIRVAPENQHLFIDENLVVYARESQGLALVDGSSFMGDELRVLPNTKRICPKACASHSEITSVVLPEGLTELGEACFSGCYKLASINLPTTLTSWGDNAFSSTRLTNLHIPASCVNVSEGSFNFGPAAERMYGQKYAGTLEHISVDERHPFLSMKGSLLCARVRTSPEETYVGLLCESHVRTLVIPACVKRLSEVALAGVTKCETLHICQDVFVASAAGLLPNGKVERLVIELTNPIGARNATRVELELPRATLGGALSNASLTAGHLDLQAFLQAYDTEVAAEKDELARARHLAARLANNLHFAPDAQAAARAWLLDNLTSVCIHFGTRNYFEGFSQLVDCGLIDKQAIDKVIVVLSGFNDTCAVAYLLELKHTRFKEAAWDYDL